MSKVTAAVARTTSSPFITSARSTIHVEKTPITAPIGESAGQIKTPVRRQWGRAEETAKKKAITRRTFLVNSEFDAPEARSLGNEFSIFLPSDLVNFKADGDVVFFASGFQEGADGAGGAAVFPITFPTSSSATRAR